MRKLFGFFSLLNIAITRLVKKKKVLNLPVMILQRRATYARSFTMEDGRLILNLKAFGRSF